MALSHLVRSAARVPLTALCACSAAQEHALTEVWLQGVSQASASWESGASSAIVRAWYRAGGMVPLELCVLFTASKDRRQ